MNRMNRALIHRAAWMVGVLLLGLLLGSCEPAGPAGKDPEGTREEAPPGVTAPDPEVTPGENPQVAAPGSQGEVGTTPGSQEEEVAAPGDQGEAGAPGNQGEEVAEPDDQEEVAEPGDQEEATLDSQEETPEETLAILPVECLVVDTSGTITEFLDTTQAGCALTEFEIPSEKSGTKITAIGTTAFHDKALTKLTIPNSVTTIRHGAFATNQLTRLSLGTSVETIGAHAFRENRLTSLIIPNSVETIGKFAFYSNQLTSLSLGTSVETIGESAFHTNQLTIVSIPNSVETIGWGAFEANPNLKTIILDPHPMLSFRGSFLAYLWGAYDGTSDGYDDAHKGKAGTWTWDGDIHMWSFEAATTP